MTSAQEVIAKHGSLREREGFMTSLKVGDTFYVPLNYNTTEVYRIVDVGERYSFAEFEGTVLESDRNLKVVGVMSRSRVDFVEVMRQMGVDSLHGERAMLGNVSFQCLCPDDVDYKVRGRDLCGVLELDGSAFSEQQRQLVYSYVRY